MNAIQMKTAALAGAVLATLTSLSGSTWAQEVARDGLAAPTVDTSLIGLFLEASLIVQAVMVGLLLDKLGVAPAAV